MPADLTNEEAMDDDPCDRCGIGAAMETLMCPACVDAARATLLASLIEKVGAERPVLTTASTVVDAAYHEAYCRFLTLLRTEAENGR